MGQIRTHRTLAVDAAPATVWAALERVDDYPSWWPWLRELDARSLEAGERWACRIKPPLPWSMAFEVDLRRVGDGVVRADIRGDIRGTAGVVVAPSGSGGSTVTLEAALSAQGGATALLHRLAPSVSRWAHDRVIDAAFAQFRDGALGGDGTTGHPSR
ncbi:MAG TPA: SRPBCC family protein [Acidimicrobiales bacterium]|nr:SRPBCC family protein [Acidimicrobiales bacterium]